MLKKLQSLKAKKGFTLVELIVVIAIIAVLAAILVPTMLGYVTSSRVTSADSTAASLGDTVGNSMVEIDTKGYKVPRSDTTTTVGLVGGSDGKVTVSGLDSYSELKDMVKEKIDGDYNFTKAWKANVYLKNGKVIGSTYCSDGTIPDTDLSAIGETALTSGKTGSWDNTDGVMGDYIIGTSPKVIKS